MPVLPSQLDNVLLQTQPDGRVAVKLCDFGYSKDLLMWSACKTRCGTPEYVAPEVCSAMRTSHSWYRASPRICT